MTTASYNRYSRWLHWIIAFLILFMIFFGWSLEIDDTLRRARVDLHKSTGILILLLSLVRIGVRLAYKAPPEPPMPQWQALAAKSLHIGFYVVMIAMPLTGWLLVSTNVRPIPFFGLIDWPHLPVPQGEPWHGLFSEAHHVIAKLIIYVMVPLHVLAALKHHFVDKDAVMAHMVPGLTPKPLLNWRWIVPLGVALAAVVLGYTLLRGDKVEEVVVPPQSPPVESADVSEAVTESASSEVASSATASVAPVPRWAVDKSTSRISFSTSYQGEAVSGSFTGYSARIDFDPERLEESRVRVTIDMTSLTSSNADHLSTMKGSDIFAIAANPKAEFNAASFTKTGANAYIAHGRLTLRGVSKPLDLPFTLNIKNAVADMSATVEIDRTAFGVGTGEYASTAAIAAKVPVAIKLKARAS